jgi:hypothetical protein
VLLCREGQCLQQLLCLCCIHVFKVKIIKRNNRRRLRKSVSALALCSVMSLFWKLKAGSGLRGVHYYKRSKQKNVSKRKATLGGFLNVDFSVVVIEFLRPPAIRVVR